MTNKLDSGTARQKAEFARQSARRAVLEIIRESGGRTVARPVFRDRPELDITITDADPMAGLEAAAELKFAARRLTWDYARQAREDGHGWDEIVVALGFERQADSGASAADAVYDYATGSTAFGRRSFAWVCSSCRGTVIDRGPEAGHPADCEEGHADGCRRLATAITAWNASWDDDGGQ